MNPLKLWLLSSDYRAYQWLLIRFGDVEPSYQQLVYFKYHRFEVPDVPALLEDYRRLYLLRDIDCKGVKAPVVLDLLAGIGASAAYLHDRKPSAKGMLFCEDPSIIELLKENLNHNKWKNIQILLEENASLAWMKALASHKMIDWVRAAPGTQRDLQEGLIKNLHRIQGLCLYFNESEYALFAQCLGALNQDYHVKIDFRDKESLAPNTEPYLCLKAYKKSSA